MAEEVGPAASPPYVIPWAVFECSFSSASVANDW